MPKKIAIVQSNYIPWKGYFDLINFADEFVLFDDMQYTRRDWRNRNRIKTPNGVLWLTIPVEVNGRYLQKIKETKISDPQWREIHWKTLIHSYSRAKYFADYYDIFKSLYQESTDEYLSQINYRFIRGICDILGIKTKLTWSMDYNLVSGKTERLVDLCRQAGATVYLSGPSAKDYMDDTIFEQAGIAVNYMDYSEYPEYNQLFPPFDHAVSIVDLIMNTGPQAPKYMKSFQ